ASPALVHLDGGVAGHDAYQRGVAQQGLVLLEHRQARCLRGDKQLLGVGPGGEVGRLVEIVVATQGPRRLGELRGQALGGLQSPAQVTGLARCGRSLGLLQLPGDGCRRLERRLRLRLDRAERGLKSLSIVHVRPYPRLDRFAPPSTLAHRPGAADPEDISLLTAMLFPIVSDCPGGLQVWEKWSIRLPTRRTRRGGSPTGERTGLPTRQPPR